MSFNFILTLLYCIVCYILLYFNFITFNLLLFFYYQQWRLLHHAGNYNKRREKIEVQESKRVSINCSNIRSHLPNIMSLPSSNYKLQIFIYEFAFETPICACWKTRRGWKTRRQKPVVIGINSRRNGIPAIWTSVKIAKRITICAELRTIESCRGYNIFNRGERDPCEWTLKKKKKKKVSP